MSYESGDKRDDQTAAASGSAGNVSPTVESTAAAEPNSPVPTENKLSGDTTTTAKMNNKLSSPSNVSSVNPVRRFLWLDERVAQARIETFGPASTGWLEYEAARRARDGVVQIGESGQSSWAVLLLERDIASLLVRAHAAREQVAIGAGPLSEADWEMARKVRVIQDAWNNLSAVQLSALVAATGSEGDHSIANLPVAHRKSLAIGLHNFVTAIAEPLEFEANRLGRALFARFTRTGIAAALVLVVISLIGSWVSSRFEKPNIALHRHVDVSSQYPGEGEDHTLLVDGEHTQLGFHTLCEGGWVIIDLGSVRKFDKIVVYNRTDLQERAIPLFVEVSKDRQNFRQIAEKREVFDKWAATGLGAEGRYIKLRNTPPNCFHLAEVEVY
jgi:hypothetical protein